MHHRKAETLWNRLRFPSQKPKYSKRASFNEYSQRVQKVYGYDVDSQFKEDEEIHKVVGAWSKVMKKKTPISDVRSSPAEKLCIGYLKSRMEVGSSFVMDRELFNRALAAPPVALVDP